MGLIAYQQQTRLILQDPVFAKFNDFDLATWINTARGQVAGEGECVRVYGSLTLVPTQRAYAFSAITFGSTAGIAAVNNVRQFWYQVPATPGQAWVTPREFEWFGLYYFNNATPASGPPEIWSQLGQGQNGTIFVDPLPDLPYVCPLDLSAAPLPLDSDADFDAIPPLWQDAVPYFAAYIAKLTVGDKDGAQAMMSLFETFMSRARGAATSAVLPHQYAQAPDPVASARMQPVQRPAA